MAFSYLPKNFSTIVSAVAKQATGVTLAANLSLGDYISAGETAFRTAPENTMGALTMLYVETRLDIQKRTSQFKLITNKNLDLFKSRLRKISFFDKDAQPLASYNTDTHTNLYEGYDNGNNGGASVGSQWEQNKPVPFEMFFGGFQGETFGYTFYPEQMAMAFSVRHQI